MSTGTGRQRYIVSLSCDVTTASGFSAKAFDRNYWAYIMPGDAVVDLLDENDSLVIADVSTKHIKIIRLEEQGHQ